MDPASSASSTPARPVGRWRRAATFATLAAAFASFVGFVAWCLTLAMHLTELQAGLDKHTRALRRTQDLQHVLQTHPPVSPALREALAGGDSLLGDLGDKRGLRRPAAEAAEALRLLDRALDLPAIRTEARTVALERLDELSGAVWRLRGQLSSELDQSLAVVVRMAVAASLVAALAFVLAVLARRRTDQALRLGGELEHALRAAEQARRDAQQASTAKSRFLATVSHELRTPMTAILGTTELLQATELDATQRHYLAIVHNGGESLLRLIGDVLDLSRIEAGRLALDPRPVDLEELLDDTVRMFSGQAATAGLSLGLVVHPAVPASARLDGDRLRQVLTNLVGNALKFTDAGEVMVRAAPLDAGAAVRPPEPHEAVGGAEPTTWLELSVSDTGPGLPAGHQAAIFEAFHQVDSSSTRAHGGTGLGLAIARRLVQAMGGQLGVDSAEGRGCRFWLRLPVVPVEGARAGRRPSAEQVPEPVLVVGRGRAERAAAEQLRLWGLATLTAHGAVEAEHALLAAADGGAPVGHVLLGPEVPVPDLARGGRWSRGPRVVRVVPLGEEPVAGAAGEQVLHAPVRPKALAAVLTCAASELRPLAPTLEGGREAEGAGVSRRRRVLVVDDQETNRQVVGELLRALACDVVTVDGGEEALALAAAEQAGEVAPLHLVFMDADMPGMDGFETTRRLRARGGPWSRRPIVALSGHVTPEARRAAAEAGMDGYLPKPVRLRTLKETLRAHLDDPVLRLERPTRLDPL